MRRIAILVVALLFLAACGGSEAVEGEGLEGDGGDATAAAGDGEATGGTVVAALSAAPDQLDPHLTTASPSFTINENVYETLVQTTPDFQFEPELATEWQTSDDQLTWTFTLRDGVTFHDGDDLTAADVVYSLNRVMDPDSGAANAFRLEAVESVEEVDDSTVEITLSQPAPNLLANLSNGGLAIIPDGGADDGEITEPVGTGPFQFVEYNEGSNLRAEAYPDWWGEGPFVDGVEFRFISEATTALTSLQTGEVDWTENIPPQNVLEILESPDLESDSVPSTDYWYIAFNFDREPFDNPQVREALTIGFDREAVRSAAQFEAATVNQTAIPESSVWHFDYSPYSYDPERAQQLLDEAGATDLSFGILVSNEFPQTVQAAQVLESQWGELGVTTNIESVEFATWLDRNAASDFDAKLLGWLGNVDPNDFYFSQHVCDGQNNTQNYCNEQVDQLLNDARTQTDTERRKELYDQAVKIIVDEQSYVYLYNPDIVQAWQPALEDYEVRADGQILFSQVRLNR